MLSGLAQSNVYITEFMAANNATLADEDGSYPDWIEIYNSGADTVNLGGWYLANSAANLTKWPFPATNLGPNRFLIVFASNKDRRVPGAPLHTNFRLSASGEYLALVLPDGVTRTSEFAPFPPQYPDISYGYTMTGAVTTLVAPNAPARALIPASDIGTSWRSAGFNDSAWIPGALGAGFDVSGNYAPAIGLDLRTAMLNRNASAYLRVPFTAADSSAYNSLALDLRYDDGFVAYLNGNPVATRNAPASPAWNSTATAVHGSPAAGSLFEGFENTAANYTLSQFASSPPPAVQPADADSTGKFLRLIYDGVNNNANSVTFRQTAPGLYQTIVSDFDFRITSSINNPADGFCFMLIPTTLYGTNGAGVNTASAAAEEPNYQGVFAVGFDVYPHNTANDVSVHWGGTEVVNVTVPTGTLDLAHGTFHHARVTLQHASGGARVTVSLTPNINQSPGPIYSPITNLFVAGLDPFDCRVQFGGRTGGLNLSLDLDNLNVQFLPTQGPMPFEEFDLSAFISQLLPGTNLLAIQGLNIAPGNSNFLVQPHLVGRRLNLAASPGYMAPSSPGSWNSNVGSPEVPTVSFWPPPDVYVTNAVTVALASSSSSAVIRYTLDGSLPTTNSPVYTGPLVLATNLTVRAQAELAGLPGTVAAASYFLLDSSVTNFDSNLPLVIIDTLGQAIPDGTKVGTYAVFIDTNTPSGRTTLQSPADYAGRLAIGLHGNSSLQFPKKPFNIELQDESGKALDHELLGLPAHSDWLLYPSYDDKTLMNNVLTQWIFESMGHYAIRRKYVELFIHRTAGKLTAADYQGIYILLERIRVDENRVNIASLEPTDNAPPLVTGGYLFEKDRPEVTDLTFTTSSGQQLILLYPKSDRITAAQYDYLRGYVNAFEAALYGPDWRDPLNGYMAYIDVDSFVDYHWVVEYPKNIDGVRLSNFFNKDRNGKIRNEPIWDWDLSWGNANYAEGGKTNGWYYPLMGDGDDIWLRKLRTDPDFYQKIIDRWGALRLGVFNPTNLLARIDAITNYLAEAQVREFNCWPRLGTYVWPNPNGAAGGWDVDYVTPTTYAGIIAQFKKYVVGRFQWVDSQFLRAPTIATNASVLTLASPLGALYYTLDGSDPRASGGGLSPSARLYTGAVTLTTNAGICARVFHTNSWSPPASAVYVTVMPSLRITEINYHPAHPPTNSSYSEEDFEFVEVQNTGNGVINLAGARLAGGIDFAFASTELAPAGSPTTNSFDGGGTAFVASRLGQNPPSYYTNGPSGTMVCLLNSGTNTTRNRITFQQTAATTDYDRIITEFDFRAATTPPASVTKPPTTQNFDGTGTSYTLANSGSTAPAILPADSGSTGSFLRLVPASGSQAGRIAFSRTATGTINTVVASFDFRVTPPNESNQADGFGFALLSTAAYGDSGSGPAFSEEPNLTGTIAVGFDVFNNASTSVEPNNNHISLHWNGAQVGTPVTPPFDMSNGRFHRAQLILSFAGGDAYVTVRLTPDIQGTPGPTQTVLQNARISGVAPYESRVALGARTGGAWAAHDIDNIDVQYTSDAALAAGLSLVFLPTEQFSSTGAGSSLTTFTDLPLVTNALAIDLTFNASNLLNDLSLYWNAALAGCRTLSPASADLDAEMFYRVRLQCDQAPGGVYAMLSLTPNSLSIPGTPLNVLSNFYIPGARLSSSRLEFAVRNGGLASRIELDNVLASFQRVAPMLLNPGESILVVRNEAAFASRYGFGFRIAGAFSGSLNNGGDRLILLGPVGEPILDFSYDPRWYPITDGAGFSLVAVDPYAPAENWGLPLNWRPSSGPAGSPGAPDPAPRLVPCILVNEVLTHPILPELDRIELFNPSSTNVDIGGWFLSDSLVAPTRFRIPNGTWISPGGFVSFSEADFNPVPGSPDSFALDAEGDDIFLFSADSGGLSGYVHGFSFGASDEGVSFGRYVNSQGEEHFVAQTANSLGTNNAGPLVGPLVVSEIMYHPAATGGNTNEFLEYIELHNISPLRIALYSPSQPLETWRLRNAVTFDFPPGVTLDPGQCLLVVGFDPVGDPAGLAAFRTAYPLATNTPLFGPWRGRLRDSDERVELRKPGQITAGGTVPSVLVEAVHFRNGPPWPEAAAGLGSSLQRAFLTAYGNDPTNWFAAGYSPGTPNFSNQPPLVAVTAPPDGQIVLFPDGIRVNASASDADGWVRKLELFADGLRLAETTNAPFSLSVLWSNPTLGTHTLTASARDSSGNDSTSLPITVQVSTPNLAIARSESDIDLLWPSNSGIYSLQMSSNLVAPMIWMPVTNTPAVFSNYWRVHLAPLPSGSSFYRLRLQ